MATRYWVGGTGNWDATSTANWATSSGGASGASAPTSADDVIFDAASNVTTGAFTVTVTGDTTTPALCNDFSTGGAGGALDGAMTLAFGSAGVMSCFGSMTLPATNLSVTGSGTSEIRLLATTSGKTITTNGVSLSAVNAIRVLGIGGEWTLGSALTAGAILVQSGTFNTANYNLTINSLQRTANTGTTVINLGSSTISCGATTGMQFTNTTDLTFNAGTSQINAGANSPTFNGGGLTFYNVTFVGAAAGTVTITGANTFNNLTFTSRSATGIRGVNIGDDQTVSGTLTLGAANTAIRRISVVSNTIGTRRTITLNGTLATLADVDFRDIATAGTVGTWTGTRLGNGLNNSGITFDAGVDKYWNLAAGGNWSATAWALSSGASVDVNNFPLAQDKVIIENTGLNTSATITTDQSWWIGELNASTRSNAWTLATSTSSPQMFKNLTLSSATTLTGTGSFAMYGQGTTQTITSAGVTFTQSFQITIPTGTLVLADNVTTTSATAVNLTAGTLDLNNNTLTCVLFSSSNSNTRAIAFGTGNITLTGNATTIWNMATSTNFTHTGTPTVNCTYAGATGTRTVAHGGTAGQSEANAVSINVTAGTDIFANSGGVKNLNFTGFSGTLGTSVRTIYGDLTIPNTIANNVNTGTWIFAATSGIQQVTTNGNVLDFPLTINGVGGTVQLQDNLTMGSTRIFTLINGTLNVNSKILACGGFFTSYSNVREINLGTNGKIILQGNWNCANDTNLSLTGTGTIDMTLGTAKTFTGGGATFPYTLNQGGLGNLTISGNNTFEDITNTVQPTSILFTAGSSNTFNNFNVNGAVGNLITLNSTSSGSVFYLVKSSGSVGVSYLNIKDSDASGGASWVAVDSVNSGNNTGWSFVNSATTGGSFLAFF
jgi:hypothetical protein